MRRTPREAVELLRWNSLHKKCCRAEDVRTVCDEYDRMVGQIAVLQGRVDRLLEKAKDDARMAPLPPIDWDRGALNP